MELEKKKVRNGVNHLRFWIPFEVFVLTECFEMPGFVLLSWKVSKVW